MFVINLCNRSCGPRMAFSTLFRGLFDIHQLFTDFALRALQGLRMFAFIGQQP